jgi:hypothetical protein
MLELAKQGVAQLIHKQKEAVGEIT